MNDKERAAMQQALEACKRNQSAQAQAILEEALANTRSSIRSTSEYSEQAEPSQLADDSLEPVAWVHVYEDGGYFIEPNEKLLDLDINTTHDLYAAPVRTKDLTDEEIEEIGKSYFDEWSFGFARAVIAADREKNK